MSNKRTVIDDKTIATIVKDPVFQAWYQNLWTQKKSTADTYKYGLIRFCQFTSKSPSQLIQEAYEDYRNRKMPWENRYQIDFEQFIQKLRPDPEHSNNSKDNWIKAVKNFYQYHKILLGPAKGITRANTEEYLDIPLLKIEDIQKAVLECGTNKMLKAFILTLFSTGQSQAEVRKLMGKHLMNIQDGVAVVSLTRGKTNFRYTFFIGPEALAAIREYKPDLKNDEFVFTQQNNRKKPYIAQEIGNILKRHAEKLGFDRSYFSSRRFRKNYFTVLTGNMDNTYINFTMGHKLKGVDSHYFVGKELEKMRLDYLKNLPLLTVYTDQERLLQENIELKAKTSVNLEARVALLEKLAASRETAIADQAYAHINRLEASFPPDRTDPNALIPTQSAKDIAGQAMVKSWPASFTKEFNAHEIAVGSFTTFQRFNYTDPRIGSV